MTPRDTTWRPPGCATASTAFALLLACAGAQAADPPPPSAQVTVPHAVATAAAPVAAPAATPSRVDLQAQFRSEFDGRNYEAAAATAKRFAEATEREVGTQGEELQIALMNLGLAQYLSGDYVGAEASYTRAIELTEASPKPRVERLARANAGLAATYYAGRRYDLAVSRFEKAAAYNRRSDGLLSESQLPLLDKFATALTSLGRLEDALQVQKYVLRIAQRKYGDRDPRIAPTLEKIGRWYAQAGAYDQSMAVLRQAVVIVQDAEGPRSRNLVGPLTAMADCARRQLTDPSELARAAPDMGANAYMQDPSLPPPFSPSATASIGQKALDRAVDIATTQPEPSNTQVADVRTQYGDWFQTRSQPDRALQQYELAWQSAAKVPYKGKTLADALFDTPTLLTWQQPSGWNKYSRRPSSEILLKAVILETTVGADGLPKAPKVIDDSGDARRKEQAVKALATARYRPRFDRGTPTDTPGVQFVQVFQVLVEDEAPPQETPAKTSEPASKNPAP